MQPIRPTVLRAVLGATAVLLAPGLVPADSPALGPRTAAQALPAAPGSPAFVALQRRFDRERQELVRSKGRDLKREDFVRLSAEQADELEAFIADAGSDTDRINARLMQVDMLASFREHIERAKQSLAKFRPEIAGPVQLLTAAEFAAALQMQEQRERWIRLALEKPAPLRERMAAAMILMTRLVEVDLGERIFDEERQKAADAEAKAIVDWYRCAAIREREDLPDGAYDEALAELARERPQTRYGRIAKDRLAAMSFETGSEMLPLVRIGAGGEATPLRGIDGKPIDLSAYEDEVVLVDFFAADDPGSKERLPILRAIAKEYEPKGLAVVGISFDPDRATLDAALKTYGIDWRIAHVPEAWESDLAQRLMVEQVPRNLLVGRDGKLLAIDPFVFPEDADLLRAALADALDKSGR